MPSSGYSTRSGFVRRTPATSASPFPLRDAVVDFARGGFARLVFVDFVLVFMAPLLEEFSNAAGDLGISRVILVGGLSSRKPWNEGCRRRPSLVHSPNSTWATNSGLTHVI